MSYLSGLILGEWSVEVASGVKKFTEPRSGEVKYPPLATDTEVNNCYLEPNIALHNLGSIALEYASVVWSPHSGNIYNAWI